MIKKSIIFFLVVFFSWSMFLSRQTVFSYTEHLSQKNLVSIEHFQYDKTLSKDRVIIGTSLSEKINTDSIVDAYNLALIGQSILDGLEILRHSNIFPKEVLIETNLILIKEDKNFLNNVKSPLSNFLKKNLIALRTDKHPLAWIGNEYFIPCVTRAIPEKKAGKVKINNDFFQQLLSVMTKSYDKPIKPIHLNYRINSLKEYVSYLQNNNVKVIFFEMPINSSLITLNRPTETRKEIKKVFPDITYIDTPADINSYKTTDGIHLSPKEANQYSIYLQKMLDLNR